MKMKRTMALVCLLSLFLLTGCGLPDIRMPDLIKPTPTPVPVTATPSPTPAPTVTPAGITITPSPRRVGSKNGSAGSLQLSNATGLRFRQIYLQEVGNDGWGKNLIPQESSIHPGEILLLFYPASSTPLFNMLLRDTDGRTYELDEVQFSDMSSGVLRKDQDGTVYIQYMSLSQRVELDTRGTSSAYEEEDDDDDEDDEEDIEEEDPEYDYDDDDDDEEDDGDWEVYYYDEDEDEEEDDWWDEDEEEFDIVTGSYYYYGDDDGEE